MRRFQPTTLVELFTSLALAGIVLFVVLTLAMRGCSNDTSEAIRSLESNGFTRNKITDYGSWGALHGCSNNDPMWYEASSVNPIGQPVKLVVCCGGPLSFKGCTIRTK